MKIELEKFKQGLGLVDPAVAKRSTLPVLSHVLLKAKSGKMTLGANNLEMSIACEVPVDGEETVAVTVPFKLLSDYVNTLVDDVVELTLDEERAALKLETSNEEANIKGLAAVEFPGLPEVEGNEVMFSQKAFGFLAHRVLIAASTDESRSVLTGVLTEFEGNLVRTVAADGFRLSRVEYTQDWKPDKKISVLIPANAFGAVSKLCSAFSDDVIKAVLGEHKVSFRVGDAVLVTQLIEETFPDYAQIIPEEHTVKVVFDDITPFLQAVKTVRLFSTDFLMQLFIGDDLIKLKAVSVEEGKGEAEVEAKTEGELEIGVSSKYLTDVLGVMKGGGQVEMLMTVSSAPMLFKQGNNFIYVLMPMNIAR